MQLRAFGDVLFNLDVLFKKKGEEIIKYANAVIALLNI